MQDRFKFKAILKTSEFTILVEPYYILDDSYFIDINQAEAEFKYKYPEEPEECFWDFIDEIEKQDYVQEISSDNDLIITKDFTNLIQCTGLKDKNGTLIYEGDVLKDKYGALHPISWNVKGFYEADTFAVAGFYNAIQEDMEVIGNIYENAELLEVV